MRSLLPVRGKVSTPTKLLLLLLILGSLFLPSPFVILSPGVPQNILGSAITISETKVYPTSGKLSVTSVMVTDPDSYVTGFDILYGWIDKRRAVVPRSEVYPEGETAAEAVASGQAEMSNSQINATAAALSYLGYRSKSKLIVVGLNNESNAADVINVKDQIVSVDGIVFKSTQEIMDYLDGKKVGSAVVIKLDRVGAAQITQSINLVARPDGTAMIGVNIQEQFVFPFNVEIKLEETGGPSGGLIFALGVVEKLTPDDLIRSRNIAGTGTISTDGKVGPIGGITEKLIGANSAGVDIFFTPTDNCFDIKNIADFSKGKAGKVMKIVPVATLAEAASLLKLPDNALLPSCKKYA